MSRRYLILIWALNLVLAAALTYWFHTVDRVGSGYLFVTEGETSTYYTPLENLLGDGQYHWRTSTDRYGTIAEVPSTRRVPGIGAVYLPLRALFSEVWARDLTIIVQWLLYLLAITFFARELYRRYPDMKRVALVLLGLATVSTFDTVFNSIALAESLSNTATWLAMAFLLRFEREAAWRWISLSGLCFAWAVFLRPITGIFIALSGIYLLLGWLKKRKTQVPITFGHLVAFGLPLVLMVSLWTYRNHRATGQWVLLEDSFYDALPALYTPTVRSIRTVVYTMGGQYERWIPGSMGHYFFDLDSDPALVETFAWDDTSRAGLEELRAAYHQSFETRDRSTLDSLDAAAATLAAAFNARYREAFPWHTRVVNPVKSAFTFLHKRWGSYLPFPPVAEMNVLQKALKVWEAVLHYLLLLGALAACFLTRDRFMRLMMACVAAYIVILGALIQFTEARYLVSMYPMLIILTSYTMAQLSRRWKRS